VTLTIEFCVAAALVSARRGQPLDGVFDERCPFGMTSPDPKPPSGEPERLRRLLRDVRQWPALARLLSDGHSVTVT
jgi:hypothetical protein